MLYAFGAGVGPAILYWGELVVFIAVAWLIGRSRLTPLPARDWLLLGLGLSTFSWSVFALFVLFIALFQWRARSSPPAEQHRFNLMQAGLAVLAVAAVLAVVAAVPGGLLARPDMRISGSGDNGALVWFVDQTRNALPRPGVLSVSLWWYKIAMLAWALWLSFVLTRWLKWAWEVFARAMGCGARGLSQRRRRRGRRPRAERVAATQVRRGRGAACPPCAPRRSYSETTCAPRSRQVAATSRLASTTIAVVSDPYTTLTCDSVEKYQIRS